MCAGIENWLFFSEKILFKDGKKFWVGRIILCLSHPSARGVKPVHSVAHELVAYVTTREIGHHRGTCWGQIFHKEILIIAWRGDAPLVHLPLWIG